MSKRLLVLIALCSLLLPAAGFAQQVQQTAPDRGRILGTVVSTIGPLIAADISVRNTADSMVAKVSTAEDGRFLIENVAFGRYTVRISFIGYKTRNIEGIVLSAAAPSADLGVVSLDATIIAEKSEAASKR